MNDLRARGLRTGVVYAVLCGLVPARAAPTDDDLVYDAQLFHPTPVGEPMLWTESASAGSDRPWAARVILQHAIDPLVWESPEGEIGTVVGGLWQVDLQGAATLGRLRAGLHVPVVPRVTSDVFAPRSGLGDLGLAVRGTILPTAPVGLAVSGRLTVPTSTLGEGLGTGGVAGVLGAVVDGRAGPVLIGANVGVRLTPAAELGDLTVDDALLARVGAAWIGESGRGLSLELATQGGLRSRSTAGTMPAEVLVGGWHPVSDTWVVRAAAGAGFTQGVGSPLARVLLTVERRAADPDPDRDGYTTRRDTCPLVAETFNGIRDADGCPEDPRALVLVRTPDPDGDDPTDPWGALDPDPDGVGSADSSGGSDDPPNGSEATPDEPVVVQLPPIPRWIDDEGDGLSVDDDFCPGLPEDHDGFEDGDGCPEPDDDGDGISDYDDACPRSAETVNGFEDRDGCPEEKPDPASIQRLEFATELNFETDSDALLQSSDPILEQILAALWRNPSGQLRIEGHTDNDGSPEHNLDLSRRRAAAVRQWLVDQGVEAWRIQTRGFGETKPIDTNRTEPGRAANRRVEVYLDLWEEEVP